MDDLPTLVELQHRWNRALAATNQAVSTHPRAYRELTGLINGILEEPLDIVSYFPTIKKLVALLDDIDAGRCETIFYYFNDRLPPKSIWQLPLLRVELRDLMAYLHAFEEWRKTTRHLRLVKK